MDIESDTVSGRVDIVVAVACIGDDVTRQGIDLFRLHPAARFGDGVVVRFAYQIIRFLYLFAPETLTGIEEKISLRLYRAGPVTTVAPVLQTCIDKQEIPLPQNLFGRCGMGFGGIGTDRDDRIEAQIASAGIPQYPFCQIGQGILIFAKTALLYLFGEAVEGFAPELCRFGKDRDLLFAFDHPFFM